MSSPVERWRRSPVLLRDGVLALLLTVVGQLELWAGAAQVDGPLPLQHAAFAVMTGALLLRRVRPLLAAGLLSAGLVLQTVLGHAPAVAGFASLLVLTYSVAQYVERRREALLGLALLLASVAVYPFVHAEVAVADEVGNVMIPTVVWIFARLAKERLDRAVRAEREAAEQRARAGEALAAERRRIAREMHDVVGHGVTLMLLHAGAAQAGPAARDPATARALEVVLDAGRTALEDLHRQLRVLRDDGPDDGAPGSLADLPQLVASTGAALTVEGRPRPVPAALEATVVRVVQEGLTNARKHAPGATAAVRLDWGGNALAVEVVDDGPGDPAPGPARGFGLLGVRERAALFDGQVRAGPRDDGPGWRTSVVLPLPAEDRVPA